MYEAEEDKVYVTLPSGDRELFLTIHETDTGGLMTVSDQAQRLAEILNEHA